MDIIIISAAFCIGSWLGAAIAIFALAMCRSAGIVDKAMTDRPLNCSDDPRNKQPLNCSDDPRTP